MTFINFIFVFTENLHSTGPALNLDVEHDNESSTSTPTPTSSTLTPPVPLSVLDAEDSDSEFKDENAPGYDGVYWDKDPEKDPVTKPCLTPPAGSDLTPGVDFDNQPDGASPSNWQIFQRRLVSFWAFFNRHRNPILCLLTAIFVAYCVGCFGTLLSRSNTFDQRTAEILNRLPDKTSQQVIDECRGNLDDAVKENCQLKETLSFINKTSCHDLGTIGTPIVHCDFNACREYRVVGPILSMVRNISTTPWFPRECVVHAIINVSCFTKAGEQPAWIRHKDHPNCPGKLQFQCASTRVNPNYFSLTRDVSAIYKVCPKLRNRNK